MTPQDKQQLKARPLSELTPKEGAGLWNAVMPKRYCPFKGQATRFGANATLPERFVFMQGVERLGVHIDGYIWSDSDLTSKIEINEQAATDYLHSIGIDRFANQKISENAQQNG